MLPAPELPGGPRSALLIGNGKFAAAQRLPELQGPPRDVAALGAVLKDPELGGFTVTEEVDLCVQDMRMHLERFLRSRAHDELALVYLSCHGLLDVRGALYFAATDTDCDLPASTAADAAWLRGLLEQCPAQRQVLVLDCCFAGAFPGGRASKDLELNRRLGWPEEYSLGGRGRAVISASRDTEPAYESSVGVFTAALLEGLRTGQADQDGDGLVSVHEAYLYAEKLLRQRGAPQTPQMSLTGGEGSIPLTRSPLGINVLPTVPVPVPVPVPVAGPVFEKPDQVLVPERQRPTPSSAGSPLASRLAKSPRLVPVMMTPVISNLSAAAFSPDGTLLGTAGLSTIQLWVADTHQRLGEPLDRDFTDARTLAFSPRDPLLAAGYLDGTIQLWDLTTRSPVGSPLRAHSEAVLALAFSPDGGLLASGSEDGNLRLSRLADPRNPELIDEALHGHNRHINTLAFSTDGRLLASGSSDKTVLLWNPYTRRTICTPLRHGGGKVRGLALSPDGTLLATASGEKAVHLWDPRTGEFIEDCVKSVFSNAVVYDVAFSPDGTTMAVLANDGAVGLYDTTTRRLVHRRIKVRSYPRSVIFSPDGTRLAVLTRSSVFLVEFGSDR